MTENRKSWFARHKILTVIIGFFIFIIIVGALNDAVEQVPVDNDDSVSQEIPVVASELVEVSAKDLYNAFKANEISASQKYIDEEVIVTGVVDNLAVVLGNNSVTLSGGDLLGGVQCMLEDTESERAAMLNKGSVVKLKGKVNGYLFNVVLEDCVIM